MKYSLTKRKVKAGYFPVPFLIITFFILLLTPSLNAQVFTQMTNSEVVSKRMNSISASWIDVDNDGDLDLFVSNASVTTGNFLYRNLLKETGHSNFNRWIAGDLAIPGAGSFGHSWADYDNDGYIDCFVAGRASSRLYHNNGGNDFSLITTGDIGTMDSRGFACAWGDYNNDGFVDLVVALPAGFNNLPYKTNHLFLNNGDGSFTKIDSGATPVTSGLAPYTDPSWSDYDNDGDLDLFIGSGPANGTLGPDYLYKNLLTENGFQSFERILTGEIAETDRDGQLYNWIDYDNDGDLDLYITNYWGGQPDGLQNELYRHDGSSFTRITSGDLVTDESYSLASVWEDFDNDGDLDVYVTTEGGQNNYYYTNNGDGTFTKVTDIAVTNTDMARTYGATAGDYDNDGDIDLFVPTLGRDNGNSFGKNLLFRNDTNNNNNWITITCRGTISNSSAVGTKVRAKSVINGNPVWQMREISTQNSFNGLNSLRVHFGLGDASEIDSLVFEWPSGNIDVMTDVDVNQFITVTESNSSGKPGSQNVNVNSGSEKTFSLSQNYPNPFNPTTTINYRVPESSPVKIEIYDFLGKLVKTLVNTIEGPGEHSITWNGRNEKNESVASGLYLYKITSGNFIQTKKMFLLK
jgi:hypothetical protein